MPRRTLLSEFSLANPLYAGATVNFWTIDANGNKTSTRATLYLNETGTSTNDQAANPQVLDGEGKLQQPVYFDVPMIASVSGLTVDDHDTGIIYTRGSYRGAWATNTVYYPLDLLIAGTNADSTNDLYVVNTRHTAGTFANDVSAGRLTQVLDVSALGDLFQTPSISGGMANYMMRVNAASNAYELITPATVLSLIGAEPLDANILRADTADVWTAGFGIQKATLTDGATVTPDLTASNAFNWTVGGSRTLGFPGTVPGDAGQYYIDATVDATGGYTLTLAAGYNLVDGAFDGSANAVNRLWLVVRSASIIDVYIEQL